jgi:hypothetical protein
MRQPRTWTDGPHLHLASLEGKVDVACMVIERSADVIAQDGWTRVDSVTSRITRGKSRHHLHVY